MKRAIIILLLLLFGEMQGKCDTEFYPQEQLPEMQNYNEPNQVDSNENSNFTSLGNYSNVNNTGNTNLTKIEYTLFGSSFENQNIGLRLERIEKSLFNKTYPKAPLGQRIDTIISNFNQINKTPNISRNDLSRLEAKAFSQNFAQLSPEKRVERLEEKMFGAAQSGDLKTRLENLKTASKYNNGQSVNNILPVGKTGWRGVASNIGNAFNGGTMTGFTPPIGTFSNYGYGTPYMNIGGGNYGMNGGYSTRGPGMLREYNGFSNVGTGAGVTILN